MQSVKIWAIPGFLGLASDWDFLQWKHLIGVNVNAFSWNTLAEWAQQFNQSVAIQQDTPSVLMGYSLGGRVALHALIDRPHQWQAAIIVSAHMGLTNSQERQKRQQQDQQWAQRFKEEEWTSLMHAWNAQDIFAHDQPCFHRQEHHYQRSQLVHWLTQGSLAKQSYLYDQIIQLPMPILWITGAWDQRYHSLAQTLTFAHSHSRWETIAQAGHRVPWTQPHLFSQVVQEFLRSISLVT